MLKADLWLAIVKEVRTTGRRLGIVLMEMANV